MRLSKLVTFPALFLFLLFGPMTTASTQEKGGEAVSSGPEGISKAPEVAYTGAEALINGFMGRLIEGEKPSLVFSELITPYQRRMVGVAYDTALNGLDNLFAIAGKPFEYEKLEFEEISARIFRYKYVLYFDEQITVFDLYLYNSPTGWLLHTWWFDSTIKNLE